MNSFNDFVANKESGDDRAFMSWYDNFTKEHTSGPYKNNSIDEHNLYIGRIIGVLDYLNEANNFAEYINPPSHAKKNYHMLLNRLVKERHPEMYEKWVAENGSDDYWKSHG